MSITLPQEANDAPEALIALTLKQALDHNVVPPKDLNFVTSLLSARKMYGHWTQKQAYWARVKYASSLGLLDAMDSEQVVNPSEGSFSHNLNITAMVTKLKQAGEHLKYPKILLQSPEIGTVQFALSSKYPDTVNVTDGGSYGNDKWYGKLTLDGKYHRAKTTSADIHTKIGELIEMYVKSPTTLAAQFGHTTGKCCFCHKPLTDADSLKVGYGPVCAKHHGLPYGV